MENTKGNNKAIIIIISVLIIAAIAGIVFLSLGNKKNKNNDTKKDDSLAINKIEDFDKDLLISEKNENVLYSPIIMKNVFTLLGEGIDDRSKLDEALGNYELKNTNISANALFVKDIYKDKVSQDYVDLLKNKYNTTVMYDSFIHSENITDWLSNSTGNKITDINVGVSRSNIIYINALASDNEWNNKLQNDKDVFMVDLKHEILKKNDSSYFLINRLGSSNAYGLDFAGLNEKVESLEIAAIINKQDVVKDVGEENVRKDIQAEYDKWIAEMGNSINKEDLNVDKFISELNSNYKTVNSSTDFMFYNTKDVKVFAKDLKEKNGVELQYVSIMPMKEELNTFIKSIDSNKINEYIKNLKGIALENFEEGYVTLVHGYLPTFSFDYEFDLRKDNKGLTELFDSNSKMAKMLEVEQVSYVLQKTHFDFSNDGLKQSAPLEEVFNSIPEDELDCTYEVKLKEIDITVNKPFMYFVRDKKTGDIWFVGTVYDPTK